MYRNYSSYNNHKTTSSRGTQQTSQHNDDSADFVDISHGVSAPAAFGSMLRANARMGRNGLDTKIMKVKAGVSFRSGLLTIGDVVDGHLWGSQRFSICPEGGQVSIPVFALFAQIYNNYRINSANLNVAVYPSCTKPDLMPDDKLFNVFTAHSYILCWNRASPSGLPPVLDPTYVGFFEQPNIVHSFGSLTKPGTMSVKYHMSNENSKLWNNATCSMGASNNFDIFLYVGLSILNGKDQGANSAISDSIRWVVEVNGDVELAFQQIKPE
jgi:hypothetical protein